MNYCGSQCLGFQTLAALQDDGWCHVSLTLLNVSLIVLRMCSFSAMISLFVLCIADVVLMQHHITNVSNYKNTLITGCIYIDLT